jgi:hypothetical protein
MNLQKRISKAFSEGIFSGAYSQLDFRKGLGISATPAVRFAAGKRVEGKPIC